MDSVKALLAHGACLRLWSAYDLFQNKMVWRAELGPDPGVIVVHFGLYSTFEGLMDALKASAERWKASGGDWSVFDDPIKLTL